MMASHPHYHDHGHRRRLIITVHSSHRISSLLAVDIRWHLCNRTEPRANLKNDHRPMDRKNYRLESSPIMEFPMILGTGTRSVRMRLSEHSEFFFLLISSFYFFNTAFA